MSPDLYICVLTPRPSMWRTFLFSCFPIHLLMCLGLPLLRVPVLSILHLFREHFLMTKLGPLRFLGFRFLLPLMASISPRSISRTFLLMPLLEMSALSRLLWYSMFTFVPLMVLPYLIQRVIITKLGALSTSLSLVQISPILSIF